MKKIDTIKRVRLGSAKSLTKLGSGSTTEQQVIPALIFQP